MTFAHTEGGNSEPEIKFPEGNPGALQGFTGFWKNVFNLMNEKSS